MDTTLLCKKLFIKPQLVLKKGRRISFVGQKKPNKALKSLTCIYCRCFCWCVRGIPPASFDKLRISAW